ncbi:MAG: cytochrome c1 [Pseudomonadota bacterium]
MFRKSIMALAVSLALAPAGALAAGGTGYVDDIDFSFEGPFGTFDKYQLQRGFQVYQEICSGCHGLKYLAFRDLGRMDGPAFPPAQIKAIAAEYTVLDDEAEDGERAGLPSDLFPGNDSAGAPDLTLMAKARAGFHGPSGLLINQLFKGIGGPEYIYSLLTHYNGEEQEVGGSVLYGNDTMAGGWISMSQPLYGDDVEFLTYTATGTEAEDYDGYTPPEATQEQLAEDVAAFLMWAAEPAMVERKEAGFRNLVFVIILATLLYFTNKKLWAPIKRKPA